MRAKCVTCVKPMTHNYKSCAKVIHHMTTIVSHVSINQWQLTDDKLLRRYVKYYESTDFIAWKPKTYLWLITISHVKSALLSQIRDICILLRMQTVITGYKLTFRILQTDIQDTPEYTTFSNCNWFILLILSYYAKLIFTILNII